MSSPRLQTATTFLNVFASLDTAVLSSILADDYTHQFGPSSLSNIFPNDFKKEAFITHLAGLRNIMTGFPVYVTEMIESEGSNAVWAWCTSKAQWREEVMDGDKQEWEFKGEYVFMFWMDDSGERVVRCVEILDSKKTFDGMLSLMGRATKNAQANKE